MITLTPKRLIADLSDKEYTAIAQDRCVDGAPQGRGHLQYSNSKDNFFVGVWESTDGCWNVNYSEDEFCVILSGEAIITAADGTEFRVVDGDAFTVPAGFQGTWRTVGHVKKWYAVYDQ